MKEQKRGADLLKEYAGRIVSRMGTFVPGSHVVFRGHDLHTELKDMDWVELYVFGITGRRFSKEQLRLMHAIWTYTSYPDVRLWNNRVAALAASTRSTGNLGISAALAVSEASIYGRGIDYRAISFLIRAAQRMEAGEALLDCIEEELAINRSIAGYGRPILNGDERNAHILSLAASLGLDQGRYLRLAKDVEDTLLNGRWRMKMNYGGIAAALGADLGFSAREYYLFMFPAFLAGMQPCFIEASDRPEGMLYPVACENIQYEGPPRRAWKKS